MTIETMPIEIAIRDIGPVIELEYTMDKPGLHILRGKQGAGKTMTLRAVQWAVDGRTDVRPTRRDGTPRGVASVAGRVLQITRRTSQQGELTVDGLGDLNVADLHSPKFQTPIIRDQHRISTLLRLVGAEADAALFHELAGGEGAFNKLVLDTETDDLVELAGRVKRALGARAQHHEQEQARAQADTRAAMQQVEGVDLDAPNDETALAADLGAASDHRAKLDQRSGDAAKVFAAAEKAQREFDSLERGPSVAAIEEAVATSAKAVANQKKSVQGYKEILAAAEARLISLQGEHTQAADQLASAKREAEMRSAWEATIKAGTDVKAPTEQEVVEAATRREKAQQAVATGIKVREAWAARKRAEASTVEAVQAGQAASKMRTAARKAGRDVLADAVARVPDCPLRVEPDNEGEPRLVLKTNRSDSEPFDDLSDGQRWPIILRIAAAANRLIVLPQAAFGELAPATRLLLHRLAVEHGCYLLTAEADDGELRGEPFEAAPEIAK